MRAVTSDILTRARPTASCGCSTNSPRWAAMRARRRRSAAIACCRPGVQRRARRIALLHLPTHRAQRRAHALDGIAFRPVHRRPRPCGARRPGELPVLERLRRRRAVVAGAPRLRAERAHDGWSARWSQPDAELPALSTAALIEPEESAVGVSPITTSALEPSREAAAIASEVLPATSAPRLPANIEQLADAGPENVKLAAASDVTTDVPPTLPIIEVAIPPATATSAPATRAKVGRQDAQRKEARAYAPIEPATKSRCAPRRSRRSGIATKQAPKWAQQMFVKPWQSRAFSYTQ